MSRVAIIGAGAAGMMAGIIAARAGHRVTIYEKNEKPGKKLYITGKGRCNLTNCCDKETLFSNVVTNPKFLHGAFSRFSNYDAMAFFESLGLKLKVERGERVFPASDKASDVIASLTRELERLGVDIHYRIIVKKLRILDQAVAGLAARTSGGRLAEISCEACIIASGGMSYPSTGSDGDGYEFAGEAGHKIEPLLPSLVPIEIREAYCKDLQGLSLKNARIRAMAGEKEIYSDFGEMLFTHFGISGPIVLSTSSYLVPYLSKGVPLAVRLDLKPALSEEMLDQRLLRDFEECRNKQYANSLDKLLPKKLIPVIMSESGIDPRKQVNAITGAERGQLIRAVKDWPLSVSGLRGYGEAVVTKGGVCVREVNPATMESRLVKGLYFAGEVLDVDALTGGFNLQIAWSTAYTAGNSIPMTL